MTSTPREEDELERLLERRPNESLMDHAVRLFSDDPTGLAVQQREVDEEHEREQHKLWVCSHCKVAVTVCLEEPSHTPHPIGHYWEPVPHPLGRTALVLHCEKERR